MTQVVSEVIRGLPRDRKLRLLGAAMARARAERLADDGPADDGSRVIRIPSGQRGGGYLSFRLSADDLAL